MKYGELVGGGLTNGGRAFFWGNSSFLLLFTKVGDCLTALVAQWERIHLQMQEMWIQSLGREDPLEEEMAMHCACLGNAMDRGALVGYSP